MVTDNQEDVGSYRDAAGKGNVGVEERMAIDGGDDSVMIMAGGLAGWGKNSGSSRLWMGFTRPA
jgi:hypothetical protein